MKTKQFPSNKWIIFDLEDATAIGRTIITPEGDKLIVYLTEKGEYKTALFSDIENPRILLPLGEIKKEVKSNNYTLN